MAKQEQNKSQGKASKINKGGPRANKQQARASKSGPRSPQNTQHKPLGSIRQQMWTTLREIFDLLSLLGSLWEPWLPKGVPRYPKSVPEDTQKRSMGHPWHHLATLRQPLGQDIGFVMDFPSILSKIWSGGRCKNCVWTAQARADRILHEQCRVSLSNAFLPQKWTPEACKPG